MKAAQSQSGAKPNGSWTQTVQDVRNEMANAPAQLSSCVEERPISSVLAVFGLGVAAGVGLVALYCARSQQVTTPETLARRIGDAIRDAIPQNLLHGRFN